MLRVNAQLYTFTVNYYLSKSEALLIKIFFLSKFTI